MKKAIEKWFRSAVSCVDQGSRENWEELGHGRNCEPSGEGDADEAGREASTALGSEAGADCGGCNPALCRARVQRGARGRYRGAVRHCQGIGIPALQEQGRIVLRGVQEGGAVVSEI